jgi:hypothetical protein
VLGCVDRDTVQSTGDDLIFLSYSGLGSLGRTIQEKSMPLGNLSAGISKDLVNLIEDENTAFISAYHPEGRFYLVGFVGQSTLYCFDTRAPLEDGSLRATRWPSSNIKSLYSGDRSDNRLLIGGSHGIGTYSGYVDNASTYRFKYSSPELSFGDPATLKFLKKLRPTMIGGSGQSIALKWAYDFGSSSGSRTITPYASNPTEYNSGEYNEDEYTSGKLVIRESVNTGGSGTTLAISVEADINGTELSIQEINVLALTGRVL